MSGLRGAWERATIRSRLQLDGQSQEYCERGELEAEKDEGDDGQNKDQCSGLADKARAPLGRAIDAALNAAWNRLGAIHAKHGRRLTGEGHDGQQHLGALIRHKGSAQFS
jgi:hypothetical protein